MSKTKSSTKKTKGQEIVAQLEDFSAKLQQLMDNPDGGTLDVKSPDGTTMRFTMPPLSERPQHAVNHLVEKK